jgi:uncharacterized protein YgfB (UPF0149 family)
VTHEELQAALARMDITADAAEAHGWLCGALCVREGYGAKAWLGELAADRGVAAPDPDPALERLPAETLEALHSPEFAFEPLLPAEDAPLADRVAALAAWCGGFLYGIGTGSSERDIAATEDVGEFLRDLAEIAHVELEPGRGAEAGEGDFTELFEFVRAGTQLAFDELEGARAHAAG